MALQAEHKADRRAHIQRVAARLVAERGYDGLTMRDLAHAARVSVPTLYNLFGGKDAILCAELEARIATIAARVAPLPATASFFERGVTAFEAGQRLLEASPEFFRACARMFMTSPDAQPMRRRADELAVAVVRDNLAAAKAAGQVASWASPDTVARHALALYNATFLGWAMGELDLGELGAIASSGMCHVLAGVARGAFADDVVAALTTMEVTDARR
jgi:AcrR family transcriptional regulator|nr:TetR/AcrR family transcriptional regulator [Kofleriaceae bacterium]